MLILKSYLYFPLLETRIGTFMLKLNGKLHFSPECGPLTYLFEKSLLSAPLPWSLVRGWLFMNWIILGSVHRCRPRKKKLYIYFDLLKIRYIRVFLLRLARRLHFAPECWLGTDLFEEILFSIRFTWKSVKMRHFP